jgi:hypothetical protein
MAQKRTTLRGWKKPEDGKSSACQLISSFVCIFGGIKWDCSKSLTIDCAEQLRTNPSVPGQGKPFSYQPTISMSARRSCLEFGDRSAGDAGHDGATLLLFRSDCWKIIIFVDRIRHSSTRRSDFKSVLARAAPRPAIVQRGFTRKI